jgi:hypothetical protein
LSPSFRDRLNWREVYEGDPEWEVTTATSAHARDRDPEWFAKLLSDATWEHPYARDRVTGAMEYYYDTSVYPERQKGTYPFTDRRYVIEYCDDVAGWNEGNFNNFQPEYNENRYPEPWQDGAKIPHEWDIVFEVSDTSAGFYGQMERTGWFFYSAQNTFPWLFVYELNAWVYYLSGDDNTLWFYNAQSGEYLSK